MDRQTAERSYFSTLGNTFGGDFPGWSLQVGSSRVLAERRLEAEEKKYQAVASLLESEK